MTRDDIIRLLSENRDRLKELKVKALGIYGSVARGDEDPDSDVDILIDYDEMVDWKGECAVQLLFEDLLGRRVDLHRTNVTIPRFKPYILRDLISVPPFPLPNVPCDLEDGSYAHPMPPPNSKRDPMVYVESIYKSCAILMEIFSEMSQIQFFADELAVPAASFHIIRIGNWIKKMPVSFRGDNTAINWDKIVEDAEHLEFEPWQTDPEKVWEIVSSQAPLLHRRMSEIMASQSTDVGHKQN